MTCDFDIYRAANLLMQQHGDDGAVHAAMRADARLDAGDLDGQAVWKRIVRAIEVLQKGRCSDPEALH